MFILGGGGGGRGIHIIHFIESQSLESVCDSMEITKASPLGLMISLCNMQYICGLERSMPKSGQIWWYTSYFCRSLTAVNRKCINLLFFMCISQAHIMKIHFLRDKKKNMVLKKSVYEYNCSFLEVNLRGK